ncbi:hypothetical protein P368_25025 [Comamonas thiooxydans]|nr:hypothetical protein P368_25025 [Comamonas thiooxydans]KGH08544.1 hypothetical protein P365_03305 [Comamonas thiooxydans]
MLERGRTWRHTEPIGKQFMGWLRQSTIKVRGLSSFASVIFKLDRVM